MTITQTVDIPPNRRLHLDLELEIPREIPIGRTNVVIQFPISEKKAKPRKSISQYLGILSPDTYGDGVTYQRQLRDEWND